MGRIGVEQQSFRGGQFDNMQFNYGGASNNSFNDRNNFNKMQANNDRQYNNMNSNMYSAQDNMYQGNQSYREQSYNEQRYNSGYNSNVQQVQYQNRNVSSTSNSKQNTDDFSIFNCIFGTIKSLYN